MHCHITFTKPLSRPPQGNEVKALMDETQQQTNVALGFESRYSTAASAHYQLYQECDTSGRVNIYIYSRAEFTMGCYHEVEIGMAYTELTR